MQVIRTQKNPEEKVMITSGKPTYEELENRVLELEKAESERKRAEEALKESEAHLRTLIRTIPDLVWLKDPQGVYLSCNPRFESFFGAEEKDIIGKTDHDFVAKELADFFRMHDQLAIAEGKPSRNEEEVPFADDGHCEILETIKTPMYRRDGKLAGVLGIGRDITERKRAEETLARRLEFERLVSEISTEFVGLKSNEIDAGIDRALASIGAFAGADRAYVFLFHNDEEWADSTHEWYAEGVQPYSKKVKGVQVSAELPWFFEHIRKHEVFVLHVSDVAALPPEAGRERERFDARGLRSIIVVPMKLGDRLIGFLGFDAVRERQTWTDDDQALLRLVGEAFTNAMERKRAEKEQENLQAKLSNAIEMAHLGPWEYDTAKDLLTFNDHFYKIFRTTAEEVGGYTMSWAEYVRRFVHPDDIPLIEEEIRIASEATDPLFSRQLEHRILYGDGTVGHISARSTIIKDAQGRTVKTYGVNQDITERKRAENRLRENEEKLARSKKMESLGLLAGGVAHDLNNVLSGIVSYPELLLLDLPEDSKLRKPIETIQDSGNKAVGIVQDLLSMARGAASTKEPLNLNDLVTEYLDSPEFKKLKQFHPTVSIKTDLDHDLLNMGGSIVHIRKVIMNLVSNASEAFEGSGNVIISTWNRYVDRPVRGYEDVTIGEYAVLAVSDDGPGILINDLYRIFEPFFTKKVMGRSGTGLGLAVVWNIVQDHDGYIDVASDENGTTFELYFPITRDDMSEKAMPIPIENYKGNRETILVVDDVESQRYISCRMLDLLGYKTFAVSSGEEAVEYVKRNTVNLILLDMIMDPGMNGRKTYEGIIKIHPQQKAIIVSGFAETDEVKAAQKLGAGRYVRKPLTLEKIGLAVKKELAK